MTQSAPEAYVLEGPYDLFLSHSSRDKATVERVAEKLARSGLRPWFDKWCLTPGGRWQEELAQGLAASSACAVFIGPSDVGAWEREELAAALDRAAKDRAFRLFLVLLPGLPEPFDASALSPFLSTRTWVDFRRGFADTRAFQAIINATKGIPLGPEVPIESRDAVSPYRGLQVFDEEHAEFFFGRDAEIQRLIEKLKAASFLVVVGPSGSGKSSLARAGLLPALRHGDIEASDSWAIAIVRPGAHPLDSLTAHLVALYPDLAPGAVRDQLGVDARTLRLLSSRLPGAGSRVLLLVDQCEEVFTLCRDENERRLFLLNLLHAAAADGPVVVVATLRADFYPRCAAYPELAQQIAAHQFLVGPIGSESLRQVIEEPARLVGLDFESGLIETMLQDVEHEPGALPLLEHALLELWERRRGTMLTLEAYRESGGVEGALAQRADAILNSLPVDQRAIVRRVLLRLTQPGEGAEDTRRRASMDELTTKPQEADAVESVLRVLTDARLLTTGGEEGGARVVEVSHEALIRGWPRLRSWVEEDRQGLRIHQRLTEASREWVALGRDREALYRGARLLAAGEWAKGHEPDLNPIERAFLEASGRAHEGELESARRRARRLRALAAALAGLVGVAALLTFIAVKSATSARREKTRAEKQERVATSRRLALESAANLDTRPDTALLLGLEAYRREPTTYGARSALITALQRSAATSVVLYTERSDATSLAFTADGKTLVFADRNGKIWRWTRGGNLLGKPLEVFKPPVNDVVVSGDGNTAAFATGTNVGVWAANGPRKAQRLDVHGWDTTGLALSADGHTLARADSDQHVEVWDVETRQLRANLAHALSPYFQSIALSPDGRTMAFGDPIGLWSVARRAKREQLPKLWYGWGEAVFSRNGAVFAGATSGIIPVWDVGRHRIIGQLDTAMETLGAVAFSRNGRTLAAASEHGAIELWNTGTGRRIRTFVGHREAVDGLAFSPDGTTLASSSWDGTVRLWSANKPEPLAELLVAQREPVEGIAFTNKGALVAADRRGSVRTWHATGQTVTTQHTTGSTTVNTVGLSGSGTTLAVGRGRRLYVVDVFGHGPVRVLEVGPSPAFEFSPDERVIATLTGGTLQLWQSKLGKRLGRPLQRRTEGEAIAFSPDSKTLAFQQDGLVIPCDIARRKWSRRPFVVKSDENIRDPVGIGALAYSPDGTTLASSGPDGTVRLWDVPSRRLLADPLPGHTGGVTSLAFSPDGKTLASAGANGTIRLFDVASRRPLGEALDAHSPVHEIAFDHSGKLLASAGEDGRVLRWDSTLWRAGLSSWKRRICRLVRRNLTRDEWKEFLPDEPFRDTCT